MKLATCSEGSDTHKQHGSAVSDRLRSVSDGNCAVGAT